MRYACLIYYDPKQLFGGDPDSNAALEECGGYDEVLTRSGHFVAGEALELPDGAKTVRKRAGRQVVTDGPFSETKEILGGVVIIEAADVDEAARVIGEHPLARIGAIEVRPLVDFSEPRPEL
ncbi:MAG: YciI family protein [Alphaproteobacteria bacterium]